MVDSGVGWAGVLDASPEFQLAWGKSEKNPCLSYDLSSLTKIIVTNSLLVEFSVEIKKSISEFRKSTVGDYLAYAPDVIKKLELGNIWDHRAGLKAHFLLDPLKSRQAFQGKRIELWSYVLNQIADQGIQGDTDCLYSDLDFWIFGAILEAHYKKDIKEQWRNFKKKYSLPEHDLVYGPLTDHVAPTENRHKIGEVNDDNSFFMQQMAPHAGLFSTIEGVWDWLKLMNSWFEGRQEIAPFFKPEHKERFWCGWDRPSEKKTQAGEGASTQEVLGHLGFTGTALWWNPLTKWSGILLTNRVFPSHSDQNQTEIRELRVKFFSLLWHNNRKELWKVLQAQVKT